MQIETFGKLITNRTINSANDDDDDDGYVSSLQTLFSKTLNVKKCITF